VADTGRWKDSDGLAGAPSPGAAYHEYHMPIRKYTCNHQNIQKQRRAQAMLKSCKAQSALSESGDEPTKAPPDYQWGVSASVSTQWPLIYNDPRGERSQNYHEKDFERLSATELQLMIPRSVETLTYSVEYLVSIFHPSMQPLPIHGYQL
jgi:hypothetical protein